MTFNRRFMLKGLALGGISSLGLSGALPTLAGPVPGLNRVAPLLTLVNATTAQSPFLLAAQQTNPSGLRVQLIDTELHAMLAFDRLLRSGRPVRVIGLLDDASATLVIDLARGAGAQVRWLGQHSTAAGMTHHRLLDVDNTEHYSRQLSQQSQQWMGQLGYYLASGHLAPASASSRRLKPFTATADAPISGSFVSFSIEA